MAVEHKATIKFRAEVLASTPLPPGWSAQRNESGLYSVAGPCPKCLGDAYGPAVTQLGLGGADDSDLLYIDRPRQVTREIVAACACGAEHGKAGGTSCGREWIVRIRAEFEE